MAASPASTVPILRAPGDGVAWSIPRSIVKFNDTQGVLHISPVSLLLLLSTPGTSPESRVNSSKARATRWRSRSAATSPCSYKMTSTPTSTSMWVGCRQATLLGADCIVLAVHPMYWLSCRRR